MCNTVIIAVLMPLPKNSNICVSSSWILIVVSPYYGHIFLLICIPGDFFLLDASHCVLYAVGC